MGGTNGTALLVQGTTAVHPGTGAFVAGSQNVIDLVGAATATSARRRGGSRD